MDPPRLCPFRPFSDRLLPLHENVFTPFLPQNYYRPWWNENSLKDFGSRIIEEKESYKICLDVQHYLPEEISVKVTDCDIIVEANHEERQDKLGFISRQFKRRYLLPKECPADNVTSSLSSDGVLTVLAPKNNYKDAEKIVQIKYCGFPQNIPKCDMVKKTECCNRDNEMNLNSATNESLSGSTAKEFNVINEIKSNAQDEEKCNFTSVEPKREKNIEPTISGESEPISASGVTQKDIDDAIREANELISRNQAQISQNNRLMISQLLGDSKGTEELYSRIDAVSSESKEVVQEKSSEISTETEQFAQSSMSSSSQADLFSLRSTTETKSQESSLLKETENISSVTELAVIKDVSAELEEAAETV